MDTVPPEWVFYPDTKMKLVERLGETAYLDDIEEKVKQKICEKL